MLEIYGLGKAAPRRRKEFWSSAISSWGGPDVGQMLQICRDTLGSVTVMPWLSSMWAWRILTDLTQINKSDLRALETWVKEAGTQGVVLTIFPVEQRSFCRWQPRSSDGCLLHMPCPCHPQKSAPQKTLMLLPWEVIWDFCLSRNRRQWLLLKLILMQS